MVAELASEKPKNATLVTGRHAATLAPGWRRQLQVVPVAVSRHLKVLERAGLIARSREAQWRPCRLQAAPLQGIAAWTETYRCYWEQSFDRMDVYLQQLQRQREKAWPQKKMKPPPQLRSGSWSLRASSMRRAPWSTSSAG